MEQIANIESIEELNNYMVSTKREMERMKSEYELVVRVGFMKVKTYASSDLDKYREVSEEAERLQGQFERAYFEDIDSEEEFDDDDSEGDRVVADVNSVHEGSVSISAFIVFIFHLFHILLYIFLFYS